VIRILNGSGCLDALTAPDVARSLDAFVTKTVTTLPREGNAPVRIAETDVGMLNSIGLANPGRDAFIADTLPYLSNSAVIWSRPWSTWVRSCGFRYSKRPPPSISLRTVVAISEKASLVSALTDGSLYFSLAKDGPATASVATRDRNKTKRFMKTPDQGLALARPSGRYRGSRS